VSSVLYKLYELYKLNKLMSEYTEQNNIVRNWKNMVQGKLKSSLSQFSEGKTGMVQRKGRGEDKVANSLKGSVHIYYNLADGVTFRFERHGVFLSKGVGRGYKMTGGMVTKYSKNQNGKREAVDWFNAILEANVPELANRIAEINADAVVNAGRMKIK